MKSTRRLLVGFFATAVLVSLFPAVTAGATGATDCWRFKDTERDFAHKINVARDNGGKTTLGLDPQLSKVARRHSWEMLNKVELYHTPTDKLMHRVTNWTILGENVGVGTNVDSLHEAFMESPAHKANIMYTTFKHVGVGVKQKDGRMWVTVIFEAASNPDTTLRMPTC